MNSTDLTGQSEQENIHTAFLNGQSHTQTDIQHENITADNLPDELWLQVFSHVDIQDMDNLQLTCKRFRAIAATSGYREIFKRMFNQTRFNRMTTSLDWRVELISRTEALRKWRRGAGGNHARPNISCATGIDDITDIETDFESHRTIVFTKFEGLGAIVDHTTGKVGKPRLGIDQTLSNRHTISCVSASRFGMIFGNNSKVSAIIFKHGMRSRDYITLDTEHSAAVRDVWISKTSAPSKENFALSAGNDGVAFSWDLGAKKVMQKFEFDTPLLRIGATEKKNIIILAETGAVYVIKSGQSSPQILGFFPSFDFTAFTHFEICEEHIFIAQHSQLIRFDTDGQMYSFVVSCVDKSKIVAMAIDRTVFPSWITSTEAPGDNWSYVAVADSNNRIHVFAGFTRGAGPEYPKLSHVHLEPLYVTEHECPIEGMSMNSAVLLISSSLGATYVRDLLTGRHLGMTCGGVHHKSHRGHMAMPSFTVVDSRPENAQGVTAVQGTLQYFNFGLSSSSQIKRKGIRANHTSRGYVRRRYSHGIHEGNESVAAKETIKQDLEIMHDDEEYRRHMQQFVQTEMSEDEQLEYALMLSRDEPVEPELERAMAESMNHNQNENQAIMRALELSMRDQTLESEENDMNMILQLSLHER